jgi:TDG/mug DNA glycosylase family protein
MDRATVDVYEERGLTWAAARKPVRLAGAREFGMLVAAGAVRVDLGCGAGHYLNDIGQPAIGIDAARTMLERCRVAAPSAALVQGDLEMLPFKSRSLYGGWANMSYLHLPGMWLPAALADLHRVLVVDAPVDLQVLAGDYEGNALAADDIGGRFFCAWRPEQLVDVMTGAGFEVQTMQMDHDVLRVRALRLRTLPDFVGPDMKLLVVGLNPSLFAADVGVGYARPGNRFWPSAMVAGLVTCDRDPWHALRADGVGMTDLVKRATVGAAEIAPGEYRAGLRRLERLVSWLAPRAVCMVGLSGWRAAVGRDAQAGAQETTIAGRPVYVMPSTSGANARTRTGELVEHLSAAAALARESSSARSTSVKHIR